MYLTPAKMAGLFRLLDFPDEILFLIAGCLESSRRDLCALACVCVRISEIADRYCYRHLIISSEDQFKRLSNAISRKPQRLAFMQELILVPTVQHTPDIMIDLLSPVLASANMLQHLTVELPFHEDHQTAASLKTEYQDQVGELFADASLVSCIPKPRPFHRLRSCKYNFSLASERLNRKHDQENNVSHGHPACDRQISVRIALLFLVRFCEYIELFQAFFTTTPRPALFP